jgi:hypothetical protein
MGVLQKSDAISRAVSVAAQKYGGDSTHPIWRDVGTISFVGSFGSCGSTYAKFHSSPALQSMCQKPSLISHLAMKIFASSSASANAWMIRLRVLPSWSRAPLGVSLMVVSLTESRKPPFLSRSWNKRSKIDWKSLDL